MDNSANVGAYLLEKVRALAPKHACLGNIRGAGLFVAADIVSPRDGKSTDRDKATRVINAMREDGVLISACGTDHNILKIRPPLIFTRENVDFFAEVLDRALA